MRACEYCGKSIVMKNAQARFCSDKCRNYARLRRLRETIPAELTDRDRWVRYSDPVRKIPLTVDGGTASSTDPDTWASYAEVKASRHGAGIGFVLGCGIACVDLDYVINNGATDPRAVEFLSGLDPFYLEVSPSGNGIHAWVRRGSPTGRNKYTLDNGLRVEWYEHSRYITVTGTRYEP